VGIEVGASLAFAVDQQVVAVENGVVAAPEHAAVADRDEILATGGDDVQPLMDAPAVAACTELSDGAAQPVWPVDREDVPMERDPAVAAGTAAGRRSD
jgi:hypothetical protein